MKVRILVFLIAVALATSATACLASAQNAPQTAVAAPTALPQSLGEHPVYVLDVLNGRLISELIGIDADRLQTISTLSLRYTPEILFSADGKKLYVLDAYFTRATRGDSRDVLSVFDANTLEIEQDDLLVPDRLRYKVFPADDRWFFSSPDGKYLFVAKYGKPDVHALRLTVLDAATFQQLAEYPLPSCDGGQVHVLKDARLLCLIGDRLVAIAPLTGQETPLVRVAGGADSRTLLSAERTRWYRLEGDGRATVVDLASSPPRVLVNRAQLGIPTEHSVGWAQQIVLSQDGARLFVGMTPESGELFGAGVADVIRVYDTETWTMLGELKPDDPAQYISSSRDGTQLYMTNAQKRSFAVYDAFTLRERGTIHDLGISPSQILVPPQ